MKLALVNPGSRPFHLTVPFNLCYLASYARAHTQWEVVILDEAIGTRVEDELQRIKPDLVGITAATCFVCDGYRIADFCRTELNVPVVMGGVHASALPEEALRHADVVVVGQGEQALVDILVKVERGSIPRGEIVERPYLKNLDEVPLPAWDLIDLRQYLVSKYNSANSINFVPRSTVTGALITSRGCPFRCTFCYNSKRTVPVRYHSAERVLEEISVLRRQYGAQAIFFFDDEFITNKARLKKICAGLAQQEPLPWACQARADLLNEEMLELMKAAGCCMVGIGFETGVQRVLDLLNKRAKVEDNVRAIELCRKVGVKIYGNFILGMPSETHAEMLETLDFIKRHELRYVSLAVATPFPSTALWDTAAELNLLPEDLDYSKLDLGSMTICDTMERDEFYAFFQKASLEVGIAVRRNSFLDLLRMFVRHPVKGMRLLASADVRRQLMEKTRLKFTGRE